MPQVRGCNLPEEFLYDVENNIWYAENADGTVTIGMTAVAAAMAGKVVALTPKKVGRSVKPGKSCATIESGKWVGPAKLGSGGEVVEINDDVVASPAVINEDPYTRGWILKVRPDDWAGFKGALVAGSEVAPVYEAKMAADGFEGCGAA